MIKPIITGFIVGSLLFITVTVVGHTENQILISPIPVSESLVTNISQN
jgi:hypothetical protein